MKRFVTLALAALAASAMVSGASAQTPPVVPFPGDQVGGVFVSAQTITTDGAMSNYFGPGDTVVFRAYAVDARTHKLLTKKAKKFSKKAVKNVYVRDFYVKIPNVPNVQMRYTPKARGTTGRFRWTGTWKVPADYPAGSVPFRIVVRTWTKRLGSFEQAPIATARLTIAANPQVPFGPGPTTAPPAGPAKVDVALYVDTVNGTRPAGTAPRPIGCTQTNVWKRGEQLVVRAWGFDLASAKVLSMENVTEAHFSITGQPNVTLNWGGHGAAPNRVWFWANAWQIPKDYPLGDVTIRVSFTTTAGKVGTLDYPITIIP
ncbi:MAG TPA: hypothetical protein VFU26_01770 [Gaiellaceae bacterium]|nr:hypothetical protein [Gaiellaceae bacterium]